MYYCVFFNCSFLEDGFHSNILLFLLVCVFMKLVCLYCGVSEQAAEKICTKESCPDQSHHPLLSSQTSQKSFVTL